jgi:carbamoyltransferase
MRQPKRSPRVRRWAGSRAGWNSAPARWATARPFAPSVLREEVANWFDLDVDSPYMLLVAPVAQQHIRRMTPEEEQLFGIDQLNVVRSAIPAVTHVGYSARVQTVRRETNPTYYELISRFHQLTGCPVIINTSFNVRSELIVCTPRGRVPLLHEDRAGPPRRG